MSEVAKKWYVVRTAGGKEKKAKEYIEKEIEALGLGNFLTQVLIPTEKYYQVKNGKRVLSERIFYPGYLLVEAVMTGEIQHVIRNITYVAGFLSEGKDRVPVPVRESEINRIMGKYLVSPNPHIHAKESTSTLMRDVVIALLPAVIVSVVFYGLGELVVLGVSVASCVLLEYLITRYMLKKPSTVCDWSAAVTGLLLAMNLPASTPWWVVVMGAIFAIGVAKLTFGGLGQNVFNPAIAGRVFLLVSYPTYMTSWAMPQGLFGADAVSGATPLGVIKEGLMQGASVPQLMAENGWSYGSMLFANIGGSAGEISAIALLAGFVYLLVRGVIKPYITLSIWGTVIVFAGLMWLIDPSQYTGPIFNLLTGGMILGSCFMATDYVTSPMSDKGGILFGFGIGLIAMLIRYFGSYPEGVSFAILIMNMCVPLINRAFHQKKYGRA